MVDFCMRVACLIMLIALSGCASLRPQPASQKILNDYENFVQQLNLAVENGELDPTQAMIIEQQIKYQAMYAYQHQKQIEEQQKMQSMALLGAMAGSMQPQTSNQPVVIGGNNSMTCWNPSGSQYSYCN